MKLRPSILDQYMKDLDLQAPVISFLSDTDRLYLEDDAVRIALTEASSPIRRLPVQRFVTGLVIACRGVRSSSGDFQVTDWTLPGVVTPVRCPPAHGDHQYIGFVSGLGIGSPSTNYDSLLRLRDCLVGALSNNARTASLSRSIVRLVVTGTTISAETDPAPDAAGRTTSSTQKPAVLPPLKALDEADTFLSQIACSIPVDVVPGSGDPTSLSLPQHPIHPVLLPRCRKLATFQSVTNPYSFSVAGVRFVGTSGQPVEDIMNFSEIDAPIDALKLIAEAQYLCPTSPDTLPCYPFTGNDPFCFAAEPAAAPHVIFSGGHRHFGVQYYDRSANGWTSQRPSADAGLPLVLCIPQFSESCILVLVDLASYCVETIKL